MRANPLEHSIFFWTAFCRSKFHPDFSKVTWATSCWWCFFLKRPNKNQAIIKKTDGFAWTHPLDPVIINQDCHSVKTIEIGWLPGIPSKKWMFPKIGVPQNGWFIMENTIKMDDLGGVFPLFSETSKWFKGFEVGKPFAGGGGIVLG